MKPVENKVISFRGQPIKDDATGIPFKTLDLIKIVLENSQYASSSDVIRASVILGKLVDADGVIGIEDPYFDFIAKQVSSYLPLAQKGLAFLEFFQQFSDPALPANE